MCYHTLDAFVIQALRRRWICDPTPPRWFECFFAEKTPKEFGHCLQAQRLLRCHWISDQTTSNLVSPYHQSRDSTLCFLARESMRCSRTVDSMVIRVHWDLSAHSRRFECFCNIRLIEFGKCTESTSTMHVPSDHWSYDLDAHITVAGN